LAGNATFAMEVVTELNDESQTGPKPVVDAGSEVTADGSRTVAKSAQVTAGHKRVGFLIAGLEVVVAVQRKEAGDRIAEVLSGADRTDLGS
jgi:hypothetical protein